ncbi:MAG: pilus assembly protein [candidate division Zixibacteria bacterium]|nr:pilus assembly protein [candidate division Zixibacteria bacterium]
MRLIGRVRRTDGNAVIEMALLLPILLLVIFGITEFGRAVMTTNVINSAAREGARLAAVSQLSDTLSVQARVEEVMLAANVTPKTITVQYFAANNSVRVEVTSDFVVLSGDVLQVFTGTIELSGTAVMRYEL